MSFRHEPAECLAERCIERVCEAAFRLGEGAAELMPAQPWRAIRGMGNRLRHAYDQIEVGPIWDVVTKDLPILKQDTTEALARLRAKGSP